MTTAKLDLLDPQEFLTPELVNQCTMEELAAAIQKLNLARDILWKRHVAVYTRARLIYEKQYPEKEFAFLPDDLKPAYYGLAVKELDGEKEEK